MSYAGLKRTHFSLSLMLHSHLLDAKTWEEAGQNIENLYIQRTPITVRDYLSISIGAVICKRFVGLRLLI
jgi:hypothetical protein